MKSSFPQVIRPKNMRVREIQDPDITKSDPSKSDGNRILDLVMDEPKLKIFKRIVVPIVVEDPKPDHNVKLPLPPTRTITFTDI